MATKFVSSSEQIWRIVSLLHLLTNGSSAVNSSRLTNPLWSKILYVCYKQIINTFLASNESSIHNIFSWEKIVLSESGEKYAKAIIKNKTVLNKYVSRFWCNRTSGDGLILLEEVILWIDFFFLARSNVLKFKRLNEFVSWKYNFSLHKTLTDVLES